LRVIPNSSSVGADLNEINALTGPEAYEFSALGQRLMHTIEIYPAPVIASIAWRSVSISRLRVTVESRLPMPSSDIAARRWAQWPDGAVRNACRASSERLEPWNSSSQQKKSQPRASEVGLVEAVVEHPLEEALSYLQAAAPFSALV
jgi:hypothetical protein